jgi:hypothetical protein
MNDRGHTNSVPSMHAVCRLRQATFIQTNCVHSWYGVGVTPVIHSTELMRFCKVALRSTKICIKWLWPVNVTLEIIKRRLLVFLLILWWNLFKMRRKKFPSLQFMNRDRMRLLLTLLRNGRSMPLKGAQQLLIACLCAVVLSNVFSRQFSMFCSSARKSLYLWEFHS